MEVPEWAGITHDGRMALETIKDGTVLRKSKFEASTTYFGSSTTQWKVSRSRCEISNVLCVVA